MKRFIQLAMVLLLAMALLLVACDPKVDGHSSNFGSTGTGSGETGSGSDDPGTGSGETGSGSDDPETPSCEPLWHEEPITVDNAAAAIRAFFNEMETYEGSDIDIGPDKPILNLIGRQLSALELDRGAFQEKLNENGHITATWAEDDGKLTLAESIAEGVRTPDGVWHSPGEYEMIQDADGNWSFSVSGTDNETYGCTGTLKKDNESGSFVLEKEKKDASKTDTTTFNSHVCAYDEVVLVRESEGFEDEAKMSEKTTHYFVDGNIPDGAKILETIVSEKHGEILFKREKSYTAGHDGGIHVANGLIQTNSPEGNSTQKARAWFPEEDGQLPIPDALKDLGIPDFTIKGCSFSTDVWGYMFDSPFNIFTDIEYPIRLRVSETKEQVKSMLVEAGFVYNSGADYNFVPSDTTSAIRGIDWSGGTDYTTISIDIKKDGLEPFNQLVD